MSTVPARRWARGASQDGHSSLLRVWAPGGSRLAQALGSSHPGETWPKTSHASQWTRNTDQEAHGHSPSGIANRATDRPETQLQKGSNKKQAKSQIWQGHGATTLPTHHQWQKDGIAAQHTPTQDPAIPLGPEAQARGGGGDDTHQTVRAASVTTTLQPTATQHTARGLLTTAMLHGNKNRSPAPTCSSPDVSPEHVRSQTHKRPTLYHCRGLTQALSCVCRDKEADTLTTFDT